MAKQLSKTQLNTHLEKLIQRAASNLRKVTNSVDSDLVDETFLRYMDKPYKERLKRALAAHYTRVQKDFKDVVNNSPFDYFVNLQLGPSYNYNAVDFCGALRIGAAIWILERIVAADKLDEAKLSMPNLNYVYSDDGPHFPFAVEHLQIPSTLVESMSLGITFRYFDRVWQQGKLRRHHLTSCLLTEHVVSKKSLCKEYQKILSLVPQEAIDAVCQQFKDKIWELTLLMFRCQQHYFRLMDISHDSLQEIGKTIKAPIIGMRNPDDFLKSQIHEGTRLRADVHNQKKYLTEVLSNFCYLLSMDRQEVLDLGLDSQVCDILDSFSIGDPFALCFALIYLLDTDDDSPWLFYSAGMLMVYVYGQLPWGDSKTKAILKPLYGYGDNGFLPDFGNVHYNQVMTNIFYKPHFGQLNLAQKIFRTTHVVVPYDSPVCDGASSFLAHGDDRFDTVCGLLSLRKQDGSFPPETEEKDETQPVGELGKRIVDLMDSLTGYQKKLDSTQDEIASLRKLLLETERQRDKALARIDSMEKDTLAERRELADLRELVFNEENYINNDFEEVSDDISYPYILKKNMVIYGGHDTFLKVMREHFPNARFVDTTVVNSEVIKNADIVWIQNNCISHPQCWNIVKCAGLNNVPLRYFVAAGTDRCSRQLIDADND